MKKLIAIAVLLFIAAGLAAQTAYTPPVLPPVISTTSTNSSIAMMVDINTNVKTYTDLLLKHDADLYSPSGLLATKIAAIPAGANTPTYDAAGLTNVTLATQGGAFCWPNTRLGNISRGATADRAVTISAGAHMFLVCVASNNTGISMHAEIPAGTNVTGTINIPNTGGWSGGNYVWVSAPITLTGPATSVHLVFDTGGLDFGGFSVQ